MNGEITPEKTETRPGRVSAKHLTLIFGVFIRRIRKLRKERLPGCG